MGWFSRTPAPGRDPSDTRQDPAEGRLLIDVRSPGEFAGGHIDGAVNLPLDRLADELPARWPDRATPMLLCCQSGMRSGMACQVLAQLGYRDVRNGGGAGTLAMQLGRPIRRSV